MLGRSLVGVFSVFLGIWIWEARADITRIEDSKRKPQQFDAQYFGYDSPVLHSGVLRVVEDKKNPATIDFAPLYRMKLIPGNSWTWALVVKPGVKKVKIERKLTLASKPKSWGSIDPSNISTDGRSIHMIEWMEPIYVPGTDEEGVILEAFEITDGDPEGTAELVLRADDREVGRFVIDFYK